MHLANLNKRRKATTRRCSEISVSLRDGLTDANVTGGGPRLCTTVLDILKSNDASTAGPGGKRAEPEIHNLASAKVAPLRKENVLEL